MSKGRRIAVVINLDWAIKHHHEIFAGIQEYAAQAEWECLLSPFAPEVCDRKERKLYHGIVGRVGLDLQAQAAKAGIPLVNHWVSSPCEGLPAVFPDLEAAGQMAGAHLHARGFRRLAYLGLSRTRASRWFQAGVRKVASAHGMELATLLVPPSFCHNLRSWAAFEEKLQAWAARLEAPVGVVALNDKLARYTINTVKAQGHLIPRDVAVVGLGNEEVVCLNPSPSITSIDLGEQRVGEAAAMLLEKLMNGAKAPRKPILLPPLTLIPRGSTDSFKVDDEYVEQALRLIAEESHRPIKVGDIVAQIPISWRSLERRFRDCRGSTISSEITRFRIERAKRLLTETTMLVKQVAEASGFANTRRLCEVFKRLEGLSPEQYRLQRVAGR